MSILTLAAASGGNELLGSVSLNGSISGSTAVIGLIVGTVSTSGSISATTDIIGNIVGTVHPIGLFTGGDPDIFGFYYSKKSVYVDNSLVFSIGVSNDFSFPFSILTSSDTNISCGIGSKYTSFNVPYALAPFIHTDINIQSSLRMDFYENSHALVSDIIVSNDYKISYAVTYSIHTDINVVYDMPREFYKNSHALVSDIIVSNDYKILSSLSTFISKNTSIDYNLITSIANDFTFVSDLLDINHVHRDNKIVYNMPTTSYDMTPPSFGVYANI